MMTFTCDFNSWQAVQKHPSTSVFVNFASFRSVHETTMEAMNHKNLKTIAIIAEGVPEQQTRDIIKVAEEKGVGGLRDIDLIC